MAGWLTRATAAFRGKPEAAPEPFHLACECGGEVTGLRTASHQKVNCLQCQRQLLVLPASPYPFVKRLVAEPVEKKSKTVVQPQERTSPVKSPPVSRRTAAKGQPATAPRSKPKPSEDKQTPPVAEAEPRIDLSPALRQGQQRRRNFRLVVVSIVALLAVTGWSLRSRSLSEHARLQVPLATEKGLAALHDGDFSTASRELTLAVQGLDTLRRTDAAAQTIRQSHREAVAASGLSSVGLSDLASEFLAETSADRQRRMQTQHGTKWLIFDASVIRKSVAETTLFELDVPLTVGDRPLQMQCDFSALKRFAGAATTEAPQRVVIAGQIEEWIVPAAPTQAVIARLRPSSAILWCDYESYRAAGYRPESAEAERETRDLLSRQRLETGVP